MAQKWAKKGHFQDKQPKNQLVLKQFQNKCTANNWVLLKHGPKCWHTKTNKFWPKNAILQFFNEQKLVL